MMLKTSQTNIQQNTETGKIKNRCKNTFLSKAPKKIPGILFKITKTVYAHIQCQKNPRKAVGKIERCESYVTNFTFL